MGQDGCAKFLQDWGTSDPFKERHHLKDPVEPARPAASVGASLAELSEQRAALDADRSRVRDAYDRRAEQLLEREQLHLAREEALEARERALERKLQEAQETAEKLALQARKLASQEAEQAQKAHGEQMWQQQPAWQDEAWQHAWMHSDWQESGWRWGPSDLWEQGQERGSASSAAPAAPASSAAPADLRSSEDLPHEQTMRQQREHVHEQHAQQQEQQQIQDTSQPPKRRPRPRGGKHKVWWTAFHAGKQQGMTCFQAEEFAHSQARSRGP